MQGISSARSLSLCLTYHIILDIILVKAPVILILLHQDCQVHSRIAEMAFLRDTHQLRHQAGVILTRPSFRGSTSLLAHQLRSLVIRVSTAKQSWYIKAVGYMSPCGTENSYRRQSDQLAQHLNRMAIHFYASLNLHVKSLLHGTQGSPAH